MNANPPESAVFTLAGTHYAFGLEWITANRTASAAAQARRQARGLRATHLAWRARANQVGLAWLGQRRAPLAGWHAAAAAFADLPQPPAEPHTMIAAFAFRSGEIWVVAASQGRLLADGDRLFVDMDSARSHFSALYDRVPRWGLIYAPAQWQYQRAKEEGPLAFLAIPRSGSSPFRRLAGLSGAPGAKLRPIPRRDSPSPAVIAGFAAAGLSGAAFMFASSHNGRPATPPPPPVIAPFYPTIAASAPRIDSCETALFLAMRNGAAPGWQIGDAVCDGGAVSLSLAARPYTPLSSLTTYLPGAALQSSARTAVWTQPLPDAPGKMVEIAPPLEQPEAILAEFGRIDEKVHGVNSFTPAAPPGEASPLQMGVPRPRPYRVMSWSLDTAAPPSLWRADLSALANVAIGSIGLKHGEGGFLWQVKGTAYVAP